MAEFNIDDYLARRRRQAAEAERLNPIQDKVLDIQRASAAKLQSLRELSATAQKQKELNAGSWVSQNNLYVGSQEGGALNLGASVVEGTARIGSNLGVAALETRNIIREAIAPEEVKEAYVRYREGTATEADQALLNQTMGVQDTETAQVRGMLEGLDRQPKAKPQTYLNHMDQLYKGLEQTEAFRKNTDISGIVHRGEQTKFDESLREGAEENFAQIDNGELVSGVSGLIVNAGKAAWENPQAAAEYIAQNIPQLGLAATGPAGMAATNIPYAVNEYSKGVEEYRKKNNGALPPKEKLREMAAYATTLALAETVGDKLVIGNLGKAGKAVSDIPVVGAGARVTGQASKGAVGEAFTEGYQTYAEGEIQDDPASREDVYVGAATGAVTGAGLSAGTNTLAEITGATPEKAEKRRKDQTDIEAQDALVQKAIKTGDVGELADPKSANYAPVQAIAALAGNSQAEDATEATRKRNQKVASKIVEDLETRKDKVQTSYDAIAPESDEVNARLLKKLEKDLKDIDEATEPEVAQALRENIALVQEQIDTTPAPSKERAQAAAVIKKDLDRISAQLTEAQEALENLTRENLPKNTDVQAQVDQINSEIDLEDAAALAERKQAADTLINLAMAVPERLDPKVAAELASNEKNGLAGYQRNYLRVFSESRIAQNALRDMDLVQQEVLEGSSENMGLDQYQTQMSTALASGNQAKAERLLVQLGNFRESHESKAKTARRAISKGLGNQIIKTRRGPWRVATKPLTQEEISKNGGLTVNSARLVQAIEAEADAIAKASAELEAAYAVRFNSSQEPTSKEASNVENASRTQTSESTKGSIQGTAKQAATGGDSARNAKRSDGKRQEANQERPATTVSGTAANATVEAARVTEQGGKEPAASSAEPSVTSSTDNQLTSDVSEDAAPAAPSSEQSTRAQNQSTEKATETQDSTEEPVSEAVDTQLGVLTVLTESVDETLPFNEKNLVAAYLSQEASREGDSSPRPLTKVKDFMTVLGQKPSEVLKYLDAKKLTETQSALMSKFWSTSRAWQKLIRKNLVRRPDPKFFYKDPMQFLIQDSGGTPDVDENVKTAISYAVYSWINEGVSRPAFNSPEEINAILGREENHPVSQAEENALAGVGTRRNVVINSLGQRVSQALGLKAKPDAPRNLLPTLESALGTHALKLLMDLNLIQENTIDGEQMAQLTGLESTSKTTKFQFIKPVQDAALAQEIAASMKGSQSLLDKLFKAESGLKEPSLEPIPFTQKTTKNTNQKVPKVLAQILRKKNAEPNYVRQDLVHLMELASSEALMLMAGAEHVDTGTMHKARRLATEAKNDALQREIDRFQDFISTMEDPEAALYFDHSVWKQQRVGIATNAINPQSSKVHRHLLYKKSWSTEVSLNDSQQMNNFRLRVMEGLGVKTDKQSNQTSLAQFDEMFAADGPYMAAVNVLVDTVLKDGKMSPEQESALVQAVQEGGENFHSLDALMSMAHYEAARQAGKESFTVQMMGEIDGVTNGPMLSMLLYGAANTVDALFATLNRGGFFRTDDKHSQYNQWREEPGHLDLYEITALHMTQAAQSLINTQPELQETFNRIYNFTGALTNEAGQVAKEGRNIVKTPLTAMVFGSSVSKAVDSMADGFIEAIYGAIEKLAEGKSQRSVDAVIGDINGLLRTGGVGPINRRINTVNALLEMEFSPAQIKALKKAFTKSLGVAVKSTMESDFSAFIAQRTLMNDASQLTFELYDAAYQTVREAMIKEWIKEGSITVSPKTGEPIHDLTAAQEDQIAKRLGDMAPVMHTPLSKESGQIEAGLHVSKSSRVLSTRKEYASEIRLGSPMPSGFEQRKSLNVNAYERKHEGPGVAMAVMSTHSADSANSHRAADGNEVLNVHDAHGTGLATFEQTAQNLNQATWQTMLEYSPLREIADTLSRVIQGTYALSQDKEIGNAVTAEVEARLAKFTERTETGFDVFLDMLQEGVTKAEDVKFGVLSQLGSLDQYALEGGAYEVSEENRAEAAARRAKPAEVMSKETLAAAEALGNIEPSPIGQLGKAKQESDQDLVQYFDAQPDRTASEVLEELQRQGKGNAFTDKLIRVLKKTVGNDLKVRMVTPATPVQSLLANAEVNARGWFVAAEGRQEIYVLSPEFVNSGLNGELLLHEMIHGALAQLVEKAQADKSGEAYELVQELETLRAQAQAYVKANNLTKHEAALTNVHELIAWGMSNVGFQTEVLAKIKIESKTGSNTLVQGMRKFIDTITALLFGPRASQTETNGMEVLIANVSGLFNAKGQSQNQETTNDRALTLYQQTTDQEQIDQLQTLDIHRALADGSISGKFDTHLRGLLSGIVDTLHGPFGAFAASFQKKATQSAMDVWLEALNSGALPFASETQTFMGASEQESFAMAQVHATMKAALDDDGTQTKIAYRELSKLYTEAYNKLKVKDFHDGDWSQATPDEQALAQERYDFVFKLEANNGNRSDYLARFAAMGLAHERVNGLLNFETTRARDMNEGKTFADKLQILFEKILAFFNGKVAHTYAGQPADAKLTALVEQLVQIEARKRHQLAKKAHETNYLAPIEGQVRKASELARAQVAKAMGSSAVRNSRSGIVRGVGGAVRTLAEDRVEVFLDGISRLRDRHMKGRYGVAAGLLNDVKGPLETFQMLLRESKNHERERKAVITNAATVALEAFSDKGATLVPAAKKAVSAVFLRTGMHTLVDRFTLGELESLISNQKDRNQTITTLEAELNSFGRFKHYFINQANALAYYKATGKVKGEFTMMNAHNIARLYGTGAQISEADAQKAEAVIEQLVALYALGYVNSVDRANALQVLRQENQRTDGNGVEFVLKLHKRMLEESKQRVFDNNPTQMLHGYTPEIYNPHTEIQIADEIQGRQLEAAGYTKVGMVPNDPADPDNDPKFIYMLKDGGLQPYLTGIMSMTSRQAKGTKLHHNWNLQSGQAMAQVQGQKQPAIRKLFAAGPRADLSKQNDTFMAPVLDDQGNVANWRYLMAEKTKDELLERDNRFERVLGAMAGSVYDKETTVKQNAQAIQALHETYNQQYKNRPESFVMVGLRSRDPEMREIWRLMPAEAKQEARKVWGYDGMMVRKDSLDVFFGYRKYSLANAFKKDPQARNRLEKLFVGLMEFNMTTFARVRHGMSQTEAEQYAKRAAVVITRGERAWQELVRETKDIIVVKTGLVLMGNIWSNLSLLAMDGVPLKDIINHHLVALKGATAYQQDSAELARYESLLEAGYTQGKEAEIRRNITRLKDALARNPVKHLIDAGLMPTIVEDLAAEDDIYSYRSAFSRKVDSLTDKLHPSIKSAGRVLYMTHDTKLYQGLSRITQLSDFVARYTLYQHLTSRKQDPLNQADAVQQASDSFVNYDIPMHRSIQYADDMGFIMFTKYFLRIQKVLLKMARENPARVLLTLALGRLMDLGPIVLEGSAMTRIGNNPFDVGAFQFPGTLDELATINGAFSIFK